MEGRKELLPGWGGGQSGEYVRLLAKTAKSDAVKLSTHQASTNKQYPQPEYAPRNRPGSPVECRREGQS